MSDEIKSMLGQRAVTHGDFNYNSVVSQNLKEIVREGHCWVDMADNQREAIDMILHKIGRITGGNPNTRDSWVDIAGYAMLVANTLPEDK